MKKILILLTIFTSSANAEIIELDCRYTPFVINGKGMEYQHLFTIDTKSKRMYQHGGEYILKIQPHRYIAYTRYLFNNNQLLLTDKGVYPEEWNYEINRENLSYLGRGILGPDIQDDGKCKIIKQRENRI